MECREFMCQWLMDHTIPEEYRPDRIKTVLVSHKESNRVVFFIDPTVPFDGLVREAVMVLKDAIGRHFEVILIRGDQRSISGKITPRSMEVIERNEKPQTHITVADAATRSSS
jgi:hypothetical protein